MTVMATTDKATSTLETDTEVPVAIVFPRRVANAPGGWRWDEVAVAHSEIEGFLLLALCTIGFVQSLSQVAFYLPDL